MRFLRNAGAAGVVVAAAGLGLGAGGAVAAGCPNEAVRSELGVTRLPECRAYEQVTPVYKQGYPFFTNSFSADGSKAILYGLANVEAAGAGENGRKGNMYAAVRTAGGWRLSSLDAPLSEFVGQVPIAYEADSGMTLWEQHTPSQSAYTRGLYARSADGQYRYVGLASVPFGGEGEQESDYIYRFHHHLDVPFAATHDYEHVIVHASGLENHLPFDKTVGRFSLYEYSGTGNHPVQVGVEGGKEVEEGSGELVSPCGIELGSGSSDSAYNALSADGETVFFTAEPSIECGAVQAPPVAEVYARLHGSLISPLPAETVHVSASECTEACGTESSKNFEGASEDGKIAYFTSTQKLTNNAVDGTASGEAYQGSGCARTTPGEDGCDLYVYDFETPGAECQQEHKCLKLVAGGEVLGVAGIAEDGQRVYYVKRDPEGFPDLYVYVLAEERSVLVARLSEQDSSIWQREFFRPVEVAGEGGRFLLFVSATPGLTADQEGPAEQLFEYDALTSELVRVSKGEDGYNDNGNGVTNGIEPVTIAEVSEFLGLVKDFKTETNRLNISQDGKTVVFRTYGKLSPYATSAEQCESVYEFHAAGPLSSGEVRLLSDGQDTHPVPGNGCGDLLEPGAMMDATGDNVLFSTADALVPTDSDGGQRDLYDARIGGGFALPHNGLCSGEGCGPAVAGGGAPGFLVEGSAAQASEAPVASASEPPGGGGVQPASKPKSKSVSRSVLLARALRVCKSKPRARRLACERAARRRYGSVQGKKAGSGRIGKVNGGGVR